MELLTVIMFINRRRTGGHALAQAFMYLYRLNWFRIVEFIIQDHALCVCEDSNHLPVEFNLGSLNERIAHVPLHHIAVIARG